MSPGNLSHFTRTKSILIQWNWSYRSFWPDGQLYASKSESEKDCEWRKNACGRKSFEGEISKRQLNKQQLVINSANPLNRLEIESKTEHAIALQYYEWQKTYDGWPTTLNLRWISVKWTNETESTTQEHQFAKVISKSLLLFRKMPKRMERMKDVCVCVSCLFQAESKCFVKLMLHATVKWYFVKNVIPPQDRQC